jgi:hypothetical protein
MTGVMAQSATFHDAWRPQVVILETSRTKSLRPLFATRFCFQVQRIFYEETATP